MIYKLYPSDSDKLLYMPETGMGFQIVEAALFKRTQISRYIVYNSELAINYDAEFMVNKRRIISEGYSNLVRKSSELILERDSIRVLNKKELRSFIFLSEDKRIKYKRHSGGNGAIDSKVENADGIEIFVRLSAYEIDKRIDFENNKLIPGTYTTTNQDYKDCVSTNDDPIDRYALPNDEVIKWAFYVRPEQKDTLQRGIVQPAFDHYGGGIEAFFANGTSKDTYKMKRLYGQ